MGHTLLFVPLRVFGDPGKGDLPRVSDANFHQRYPHAKIQPVRVCLNIAEFLTDPPPAPALGEVPACRRFMRE